MLRLGRIWVMEWEAFIERRAIMEIDRNEPPISAAREASAFAYHTRLGMVATELANGDPESARKWVAEIDARWGQETADELDRDIDRNIETSLQARR
jgi:hypothetical protein